MDFTYVFDKDYYGLAGLPMRNSIGKAVEWESQCHHQPVMEHTGVYVGAELIEGICRRCGKWGALTNI